LQTLRFKIKVQIVLLYVYTENAIVKILSKSKNKKKTCY